MKNNGSPKEDKAAENIFVDSASEAERDWFEDILEEQIEALEIYCGNNFHQIFKPGEENLYNSFPRFTYIGTITDLDQIAKKKCIVIFLKDELFLEGIVVYCSQCCDDEVDKILEEIKSIAGEAIDFDYKLKGQEFYRVVNPSCVSRADIGRILISECDDEEALYSQCDH